MPRGHFCHNFIKRISHDFDELRVKMWHGLTSDGRLDAPRFARLSWIRTHNLQARRDLLQFPRTRASRATLLMSFHRDRMILTAASGRLLEDDE